MNTIRITILISASVLILLLVGLFAVKTDKSKGSPAIPDIQFKETIFDFGTVYKGDKVNHVYKFKNVGKGVLKIWKVRSSCGCTAINLTSSEVEPGRYGEIKMTFNSKNYYGSIKKRVYVHSNDSDEPIVTLEIRGIVKIDVAVKPTGLNFREIYKGESVSHKLKVLPVALEELKIKKLKSTSKYLTMERAEYSKRDKKEFEITVTLSPKALPGRFSETLRIYTNSKIQPVIQVPVWGTVIDRIKLSPDKFNFEVQQGDSVVFEIILDKGGRRWLSINKVRDELGCFTAGLMFLGQEGGRKIYRITLKPGSDAPRGSIKEHLLLYTDDEKQPIIKILLNGVIQ